MSRVPQLRNFYKFIVHVDFFIKFVKDNIRTYEKT